jgi:PadR family transcriptional regulator, regulatory protein AphA
MSTKHVILALLSIEPMTGYELTQNVKISVESLWAATHSQIYPAMHRLAEEGLVTSEQQVRGQAMQKTVYTITPAGEKEFQNWLEQPIQYLPFRDSFKLWASYLDLCSPEILFRRIDEHLLLHRTRAIYLERLAESIARGEHPLVQARMRHLPPEDVERLMRTRSLIYAELAAQARFEIESTLRIRQHAEALFPPDDLASDVSS